MINLDLPDIDEINIYSENKKTNDCGCSYNNQIEIIDDVSVSNNVSIPKIIMQTWKTHEVPDHWKISPQSIKEKMPDWQYVLMDDNDNRAFVEKYFPDFLPYYDAFPHSIQRADAVRYCWLYIYGGLYQDLDFEVLHRMDSLFTASHGIFLVKSGNIGSYFTNSFMASVKNHPFWLEVIEEMKKPLPWWVIGKHFTVMCSTGPLMLSRVVNKTKSVVGILPARRIMACNICDLKCDVGDAFLRPLEGSSWIGFDTMIYNFFLCHWRKLVFSVIYLLILLIIIWLLYKFEYIKND